MLNVIPYAQTQHKIQRKNYFDDASYIVFVAQWRCCHDSCLSNRQFIFLFFCLLCSAQPSSRKRASFRIMSKTAFAEESLRTYVQHLAPAADSYIVGLILGQRSAQRDFVIHLPAYQNLLPKTEESDPDVSLIHTFETLQEINTKSVLLFTKQIVAFLPGGIHILGVYSAGGVDGGLLDPTQSTKLQAFMSSLFTKLAANQFVNGSSTPTPEKLVMHFNTSANKVTCKSVNIGDSKWYLSNTDWKFQAQAIKWQEVENRFAFDFKIPVEEKKGVTSLKFNLDLLLKEQANVIKKAHCFLHGEVRDSSATLDSIKLENSGDDEFEEHSIHAELEIDCTEDDESKVEYLKCSGDLVMSGHVYSRIYMQPRSTVEDTINALKEDIIRSLYTRFELHTDALIDEEEGSPEERVVQHDLPRRILIPLPSSEVKLSHYLFPGETASDSKASVQQVLGISIDRDYVEEGLEEEADPESMLPILPSEEIDLHNRETPQQPIPETSSSLYLTLSCLMLLVALCIGLFFMKDEDDTKLEMKKIPK